MNLRRNSVEFEIIEIYLKKKLHGKTLEKSDEVPKTLKKYLKVFLIGS